MCSPHRRRPCTSTTSLAGLALLALLVPCAAASAEPVLEAKGDTLATFSVTLNEEAVDHGSAKGLARSLVRYRNDLLAIDRKFQRLFDLAHLAVLEGHCAEQVVATHRKRYAKRPKRPACELGEVSVDGGRGTAMLSEGGRRLRAKLKRTEGTWYFVGMDVRDGDAWTRMPMPSNLPRGETPVPPAREPDRTSAKATVGSLAAAMARLRGLGDRARGARRRALADVIVAFSPATSMTYLDGGRPPAPRFDVDDAGDTGDGSARVPVTVREKVPGTDKWSAIGQFAFDLKKGDDGWRIVAEQVRLQPDAPYQPSRAPVGFAFLQGR